jgi:membrane protein DedA with SNARE-associated domain
VVFLQPVMLLNGLLNPQSLIDRFGAYALLGAAIIIFIECWLFPFLPGDSLLFTVGLLIAQHDTVSSPLWVACLVLSAAAVLSNVVGYLVGARLGPAPLSWRGSCPSSARSSRWLPAWAGCRCGASSRIQRSVE